MLSSKLWLFIAVVVALSALLLAVVFRSLVIPIQAAVMNLLSIGAALGVIVMVFQFGWFAGVGRSGPIEAFLPVLMFAIVFGLSMDYEVFLVSRIHEEWTRQRDTTAAVRDGLIETGRVITAAAAVMVVVFASFILGGERVIAMFGLGLAGAVFLDALVIRCVLLPAVLQLLGERPGRSRAGWTGDCRGWRSSTRDRCPHTRGRDVEGSAERGFGSPQALLLERRALLARAGDEAIEVGSGQLGMRALHARQRLPEGQLAGHPERQRLEREEPAELLVARRVPLNFGRPAFSITHAPAFLTVLCETRAAPSSAMSSSRSSSIERPRASSRQPTGCRRPASRAGGRDRSRASIPRDGR